MRISKCSSLDKKRFVNIHSIVHTRLSKHFVFEVGETIYSGPSKFKLESVYAKSNGLDSIEEKSANIGSILAHSPISGDIEPTFSLKNGLQDLQKNPAVLSESKDSKRALNCSEIPLNKSSEVPLNKCSEVPLNKSSEAASNKCSELKVSLRRCSEASTLRNCVKKNHIKKLNGKKLFFNGNRARSKSSNGVVRVRSKSLDKELFSKPKNKVVLKSRLNCDNIIDALFNDNKGNNDIYNQKLIGRKKENGISKSSNKKGDTINDKDMVHLETETELETHSLRSHDEMHSLRSHDIKFSKYEIKNPKRCVRTGKFRSLSLSDHSDIDELYFNSSSVGLKNGRNGEKYRLNGAISKTLVNGISKPKSRKHLPRCNSNESNDSASCINGENRFNLDVREKTTKIKNNRKESFDNNLLSSLSEKERNVNETKRCQKKKRSVDCALILENQEIVNSNNGFLRKRRRNGPPESYSESSWSDRDEIEEVSRSEQNNRLQSGKSRPSEFKKPPDKPVKKLENLKNNEKSSNNKNKTKTINKEHKSVYIQNKIPLKTIKTKIRLKSKRFHKIKAKKRLSDNERFLKDNKEYYMFTETEGRLRKNTVLNTLSQKSTQSENFVENDIPKNDKNDIHKNDTTEPKIKSKNKCSSKKSKHLKRKRSVSEKSEEASPKTLSYRDLKENINDTLDSFTFSFETSPVQEPWYKTYQRCIDQDNVGTEFKHEERLLKFVLPYEMPKKYLTVFNKKTQLTRRKAHILDLTRKSPRCNASTMSLFSNATSSVPPSNNGAKYRKNRGIFGKRRRSTSKTPNKNISMSADSSISRQLHVETDEEILFVSQCWENVLKNTLNKNSQTSDNCPSSNGNGIESENTKSPDAKKPKTKNKKGVKRKSREKKETELKSLEITIEDSYKNNLVSDIDPAFLLNLPNYVEQTMVHPEDTLSKDCLQVLTESSFCDWPDRLSVCDDLSSVDGATEYSSESMSVCDTETLDSFNSRHRPRKNLLSKKRKKNLTGWPTQKKKRPIAPNFSDLTPSKSSETPQESISKGEPKSRDISDTSSEASFTIEKRCTRKKSSVLYVDPWYKRSSK